MSQTSGSPVTAYARLADKIREQILSGELAPGDQLPAESELSTHYRVSRNTAREALRSLASQGLLTVKRGVSGGTFVAVPSPDQVRTSLQTGLSLLAESAHISVSSLVEIREMLEVPAVEMAALRHTDTELMAIHESLFDPAAVNPAEVFTSNREFHTRVLRATHNPLLELVAEPVFRILQERVLRDRAPTRFWYDVDRDHREILSYLRARDQSGAGEATRAHLHYLRGTYQRLDRDLYDANTPNGLTAKTSEV